MLKLNVSADVRALSRKLDALARKQIPFARAQAVNATALALKAAEQENMKRVLDAPTPFTVGAVSVRRATKTNPTGFVFVRPVAATYLRPYEIGGLNKLNSAALLKPVAAKINQYGNMPRSQVRRLAATTGVFVGKVDTKAGVVDGVWQRTKAVRGRRSGLKLLVKFQDAHPAKQRLGYRDLAKRLVPKVFRAEMQRAIGAALATARK